MNCPWCASPVPASSNGRPRRWCSDRCRERAKSARRRWRIKATVLLERADLWSDLAGLSACDRTEAMSTVANLRDEAAALRRRAADLAPQR